MNDVTNTLDHLAELANNVGIAGDHAARALRNGTDDGVERAYTAVGNAIEAAEALIAAARAAGYDGTAP